ncbi:MAG: response regulator [Lentisphaerae bacterium]|jgi:signal transduction histidine kinase/FixJ family two-component response regulator|nr:response regulator [Lentisphaerota bacterium]MBT4821191.1 response regulator [Lentisphaerota bacterium]MBT5604491.1 response regulator [Lentisphaerota bacterium]MBT7060492.1 response regulator [Lentisphaerota bacterium]MBT7844399.1 response regulator [Lentisphaerota bacterium]
MSLELQEPLLPESSVLNVKQKILIVDDRPENLLVLRRLLVPLDVEVIEATNGNAALTATLEHDFAGAILDVQMPGMDGYELAAHLRGDAKTSVIPIVFVTASYADEQHVFQGYEAGAIDYLVKPYEPGILLGKVRVFLELDRHRTRLQELVDERTTEVRRLNAVLRAIHSINQLIVREKDPGQLVQQVCGVLVEARGYRGAWVAVGGDAESPRLVGHAGWDAGFEPFAQRLRDGWVPPCRERVDASGDGLAVLVGAEECHLCPRWQQYREDTVACVSLRYGERELGLLGVALEDGVVVSDAEESLLVDVAGDIASALRSIEAEEAVVELARFPAENPSPVLRISAQGTIEYANNSAASLLEAIAEPDGAHVLPEWRARIAEALAAGTPSGDEIRSSSRIFYATFAPVPEEGHVNLYAADVTDRLRLEAQLRQAQKLESIGTLAGGVAHEINNPINGIMNYAQLILDDLEEEDQNASFAGEIIHETERIAILVKNLLQFARHDKQSHSPARVIDIVEATSSLIHTVMRHDQITLEIDVAEDLPEIKCRSQQIQQVVMNLLTNARDALNEKYEGYHEDKIIRLTAGLTERKGAPGIRLTVEDHGAGISDEVRGHMFEPFYTTKRQEKGTGLGLAIGYGIVADHHGELQVESELGEWTRFHVDLPVDNGWVLTDEPGQRGEDGRG